MGSGMPDYGFGLCEGRHTAIKKIEMGGYSPYL